jgi:chromosomal replication initiation ATPase DnaA
MTLKQIGERVGGMDYTAVAMAIKRFEQKAGKTRELSRLIGKVKAKCEL